MCRFSGTVVLELGNGTVGAFPACGRLWDSGKSVRFLCSGFFKMAGVLYHFKAKILTTFTNKQEHKRVEYGKVASSSMMGFFEFASNFVDVSRYSGHEFSSDWEKRASWNPKMFVTTLGSHCFSS